MAAATLIAVFTANGTYTWTCPTAVSAAEVEMWAAGGGSGGASGSGGGGSGGGGGGEYAAEPALSTSAGTGYTVVVGTAGTAGASFGGSGGTGGNSTFNATSVVAHGGGASTGVSGGSGTSGGTAGSGSSATVHFSGGTGGAGATGANGGGGAGSGGTGSAGNNGTAGASGGAGATAVTGGGPGGNGGTSGIGTSPASGPGGGAGGSASAGSPPAGRAGADGQARVTWSMNSPAVLSAATTGGTYTWTAPTGITSVSWTISGTATFDGNSSSGVETVVPGTAYTITVAAGGSLTISWGGGGPDMPAIAPGATWLRQFKPMMPRRLPPAPPAGPDPANLPNFTSVPAIAPGAAWLHQFKRKPLPFVPIAGGVGSTGSLALPGPGMSGTASESPGGTGGVNLPGPKMSGTVSVPVVASGSLALPGPHFAGIVAVPVVITSASLALPGPKFVTPAFNRDLPSINPGETWLRRFKPNIPGRTFKIPPAQQHIGSTGSLSLPGPGYAGSAVEYLPFPQFPLNLKFEVLINGTWLDITSMVYERDGIQITRGLPDETQSVTPSQMTLTLDNRDGRFSPNNPLGAYYPALTRNTQLRCSVVNQASANGNPYSGYRFWGEVSSWPPRWDSSQADVYCQIVVSGVLRRYVQGAPLGSTLRQYYTSLTGDFTPGAYWPCEDGNSATEIASALPGVVAATFTGAPGFASDSSFGGSDALPVIGSSVWHGVTSAAANPPGTGSITQKFPGTYHWTAPPGVAAVTGVQVTGAGGGGGDQNTTIGGGGGGGGGAGKAATVTVTSGTQYTYIVPAGGAAGAGGDGVAGGNGSFTGDSQTVTGKGGSGGRFGGSGGAGGAGPTFNGGAGGSGSAGTTVTRGSEVIGNSGGSGGGADGGQQSASWTAPNGITGTVNIFTQAAGGGGAGGASGASGHGGGGGGGGGNSSGSTNVSAGDSLTFFAGNGGAGGTAAHGGQGGDSGVSDGSVSAGGGSGGSGSGTPGSGGSGNTPGSGGGSGGGPSGGAFGGGGGGGGSGSAPGAGHGGSGRTPGPGGGNGAGGGWGSTSSGNLSSCTTGGTGSAYGGGGGGGGAADSNVGKVGGGGGPGYVQWNWQVSGLPSGGGGGSSAGTAAGGNSGSSGGTGGSAPTGGGAGGNSGQAGTAPGGGGGGGVPDAGSGATVPGAGAPGQVSFSWSGGTTSPVAADIVRFCLHVNSAGAADGAILLQILTYGTVATLNVVYHTGGNIELVGINSSSVTVFDSGLVAFHADGTPLYMSVELTASGANATWKLAGIQPGATSAVATASGTVTGASVGNVSDILVDPGGTVVDSGTALGQISYQTYADTLVNLSPIVAGYSGETAAARIARLCASQGIGFELTGNAADTPKMGPQADDTFVGLLQACTDLDRGQMSETRDQFGIGYRTRVSMQGQNPVLTADYTLATLSGNLAPVADDQFTRNSITVTRTGGASSVAQLASGIMSVQPPPNGVGTYSYSLTVDAFSDSQLANLVAWLLTVGTVSEYRYPSVQFDMARAEVENLFSVIPGLDIGDFVQVINPPFFLQSAPISQLAWGFTETLNAYTWIITINTVPESPYSEGNPPAW